MRKRSRRVARGARKGKHKLLASVIVLLMVVVAGYLYTAPEFEREAPTISTPQEGWWNRKDPIQITLQDNEGLRKYQLIISDGNHSFVLGEEELKTPVKAATLSVTYPKNSGLDPKATHLQIKVSVTDSSRWNFFSGNESVGVIDVKVDHRKPNVNILAHSATINKGGSALVIFQALDKHLETLYIQAGENRFWPQPYKEEGYYAVLIAWPFTQEQFSAKIVAKDDANNVRMTEIPFYQLKPTYRTSMIKASDRFINGKITDLASSDIEYAKITDKLQKLKAINETMRLKNDALIHKLSKKISTQMLSQWDMQRFYPLKNAARVANYGEHRYYYYQTKEHVVSESYHVGYDLASTKMANIKASNPGKVVFAAENGIYGYMPLIDHGLGLYSLYGHCSQLMVQEGQEVKRGEVIGRTGTSGLALGDHLHFGLLVQGIEVRPVEWFDKTWIKKFIMDVFDEADKIIEQKG